MTTTAITTDLDQPLDVERDFAPEVALHTEVVLNRVPDFGDLVLGQVLDPRVGIDGAGVQDLVGYRPPDSVNKVLAISTLFSSGWIHSGKRAIRVFPPYQT